MISPKAEGFLSPAALILGSMDLISNDSIK